MCRPLSDYLLFYMLYIATMFEISLWSSNRILQMPVSVLWCLVCMWRHIYELQFGLKMVKIETLRSQNEEIRASWFQNSVHKWFLKWILWWPHQSLLIYFSYLKCIPPPFMFPIISHKFLLIYILLWFNTFPFNLQKYPWSSSKDPRE